MKWLAGACGVVLFFTSAVLGTMTAGDTTTQPALTAADVYKDSFHILADGDQMGVEAVLAKAVQAFSADARLTFFQAACYRSRFEITEATALFQKVVQLDDTGIYGEAARLIVALDKESGDASKQLKALDDLSQANPAEPLLLWMVAVQCRQQKDNELGARRYATLLTMMDPGPVMVHFTYANILDELGRYQESLPHRQMAVKLEPKSYAYQGLANTLAHLKRWKEADAAYTLATELNATNSLLWRNWAWSKLQRGDEAGARVDTMIAREADAARVDVEARRARRKQGVAPRTFTDAATDLYNSAVDSWRSGNQSKTEAILRSGADQFVDDARFPFFLGVCLLERNDLVNARASFQTALRIDPGGIYGQAADYVASFANPFEAKANFAAIRDLLERVPDDPALLWTAATEAIRLREGPTALSYFARLAPAADGCPAIVYTQYADCLERLARFDEALPRRQSAAKRDPSADNFQRLGTTLSLLSDWTGADGAYQKSTSLDPNNPSRWDQWALSKQVRGDSAGAARLRQKSASLRARTTRPSTAP